MSEIQHLVVKDANNEYDIYVESEDSLLTFEDEPNYRSDSPTINLKNIHSTIRGYIQYAIGAFNDLNAAKIEKITLKFNLKIMGKAGIPVLTQGSAESGIEIQVECKLPRDC